MNKLWKRLALLPVVLFCISTVNGQGVPAPYTVRLQPFASGLDRPILFRDDGPGSGRKKFIVQQTGLIRLLQPGSRTPTDFLKFRIVRYARYLTGRRSFFLRDHRSDQHPLLDQKSEDRPSHVGDLRRAVLRRFAGIVHPTLPRRAMKR